MATGKKATAVAVLLLACSPLALGWQAAILKDSQLLGALVAATGLIASQALRDRRLTLPYLVPLTVLCAYALAVRSNAVFAVVPLLVFVAPRPAGLPGKLAAIAVLSLAVIAAEPFVNHRLLAASASGVEKTQPLYDLAAIGLAFPAGSPFTREELAAIKAKACVKPFFWDPLGDEVACSHEVERLQDKPAATLYRLWATAIVAHPLAYAKHRLAHWNSTERWLIPPGRIGAEPPAISTDNPYGLTAPTSALAQAIQHAGAAEAGTPLGWPMFWTFLAVVAAPIAWGRRNEPAAGLALALSASAIGARGELPRCQHRFGPALSFVGDDRLRAGGDPACQRVQPVARPGRAAAVLAGRPRRRRAQRPRQPAARADDLPRDDRYALDRQWRARESLLEVARPDPEIPCAFLPSPCSPPPRPLPAHAASVITADRYLERRHRPLYRAPAIFVGDEGRITGIADARTIRFSSAIKHIDLPGETLLPGLIDMHVHLTSLAEIGGYRGLQFTDNFWTAVGVGNAKKTLDAGFTTVRNVGSGNFEDVALEQSIDGGWADGPRIVPAAYAIGATGGHCDDNSLPPSFDKKAPSVVDSPADGRAKVRWLHKYGAKVIKICATGGVFSLGDSVGGQQLSLEEMKAIADEGAHAPHEGCRPRPGRRGHPRCDPRRDRHDRACQPRQRRHDPARQAAPHLVRHGHLQRRLHPWRRAPRTAPSSRASTRRR